MFTNLIGVSGSTVRAGTGFEKVNGGDRILIFLFLEFKENRIISINERKRKLLWSEECSIMSHHIENEWFCSKIIEKSSTNIDAKLKTKTNFCFFLFNVRILLFECDSTVFSFRQHFSLVQLNNYRFVDEENEIDNKHRRSQWKCSMRNEESNGIDNLIVNSEVIRSLEVHHH